MVGGVAEDFDISDEMTCPTEAYCPDYKNHLLGVAMDNPGRADNIPDPMFQGMDVNPGSKDTYDFKTAFDNYLARTFNANGDKSHTQLTHDDVNQIERNLGYDYIQGNAQTAAQANFYQWASHNIQGNGGPGIDYRDVRQYFVDHPFEP